MDVTLAGGRGMQCHSVPLTYLLFCQSDQWQIYGGWGGGGGLESTRPPFRVRNLCHGAFIYLYLFIARIY